MSDLRDRLRYPRAGWISLVLLGVMALALAWSVQGAGWLDQMDFLVPVALYAVIAGSLLGMLRGSIVLTLPIGAIIGTAVVLWTVGGEYFTERDQVHRLLALRTEFVEWLSIVLGTGYPPQMSPYAIGLGALMFATVFAAAFAVYRHHRVLDAILLLGAALIVNMSAILTDLFWQLLLFVIAAMLLWLRAALVDRQDGWQRRRVNETLEVPTSIMRTGIISAAGGHRPRLAADGGCGRRTPDRCVALDGWRLDGRPRPVRGCLRRPHEPAVEDQRQQLRRIVHRAGRVGQRRQRGARARRPAAPVPAHRDVRHLHRPGLGLVRERPSQRLGRGLPVQRARRPSARSGPRR